MSSKTAADKGGALDFIHHEASGGIALMIAAAVALVLANSPATNFYNAFLEIPVAVRVGALAIDKPLLLWINDGLMAIFFFLVGLEIKRELITGELSSPQRAALPAIAALGGMIVPALIYWAFNAHDPAALGGWAIPCATDIAFAVGVLALLGSRIPPSLKIFLLALAIIDDLGAIIIIALFYTSNLSVTALGFAAAGIALLIVLNRRGVTRTAAYALTGLFIWVCVLKSGVHATLAGVVTALAVPLGPADEDGGSTFTRLQDSLHPWVTFAVLPLFAFANAGVSLDGVTLSKLTESVPLGISLGLFIGKPVGVFVFTLAAITAGLGARPAHTTSAQLFGVAVLAGIGFTMSLFIGMLAFPEPERAVDIRIGVLVGSLVSAVVGYLILRVASGEEMPKSG